MVLLAKLNFVGTIYKILNISTREKVYTQARKQAVWNERETLEGELDTLAKGIIR